jgi:hypothetical protein
MDMAIETDNKVLYIKLSMKSSHLFRTGRFLRDRSISLSVSRKCLLFAFVVILVI